MGNPCWAERLSEALDAAVGEQSRRHVMAGGERFGTMKETDRAAWVRDVLDRLDALVPDEARRYDIMAHCSCECADLLIETFRAEYQRTHDIDRLLELMYRNPFYVRPRREGSTIFLTKAAHDPERHRAAETEAERRQAYCHCDHVRTIDGRISPTHCFCSAGWYRRIWEGVLERPVRVTLLKSVLQGDDACEFAVHL